MHRPPRNVKRDSLVSFPLMFYSYGIAGIVSTAVSIGAYLAVFSTSGVSVVLEDVPLRERD